MKDWLRITNNHSGLTLTVIAAKLDNALLLNHITPEVEDIVMKNQKWFSRNHSRTSLILTIHWIIKRVHAKSPKATLLLVNFSKAYDSIHRGKIEQICLVYGLCKETVLAIMMLFKYMKAMVCSPDGDTDCFDTVTEIFLGDVSA